MPAVSSPPSTRLPYIDDEFDVCEVFEAVFQGDFDVSSSSNGPDALALLDRATFDVSDMRMDPMRGSELPRDEDLQIVAAAQGARKKGKDHLS